MTARRGRAVARCVTLVAALIAGGSMTAQPAGAERPAGTATGRPAAQAERPVAEGAERLPVGFPKDGEPGSGLHVDLVGVDRVGRPGAGSATLAVEVLPGLGATSVHVELAATGDVRLRSEATSDHALTGQGALAPVPVEYVLAGGEGTVVAEVTALDGAGTELAREAARLFLLTGRDELLAGRAGRTSLRLEAFDRHEAPALAPEEAAERRLAVLDGEATTALVAVAAAPGPDEVAVTGTVRWTDENGAEHPYRFAEVQVWEDDSLTGDDLIATVATDGGGRFEAVVDDDDGLGQGGRDVFVRPRSRGTGFEVHEPGGGVFSLRSPTEDDVAGGATLNFTMVAGNADDTGHAFSVHQAVAMAVPYANGLNGAALPHLDVVWPNGGSGSFYDGAVQIEQDDRWDWDTIHHEFGHFVADQIGIEDNPGGAHGLGDNLSEVGGRNKDTGTRLAWGEGWPTYFGTAMQREEDAAALGVPRVGDVRYQAFETADAGIDYSLETAFGGGAPGEDNEVSVQRVLWDLYDAADDAGDAGVALGDFTIWHRLDLADPVRFSDGWEALTGPMSEAARAGAGCAASQWGIAPSPTAPVDGATLASGAAPPTFRWTEGGGGPAFRNDGFVVRFWSAGYSSLLFSSPELGVTEFTPTDAQWARIAARRYVHWTVTGTQGAAPATGPYTGCGRSLVNEQGPGSIEELAGCRANALARNDDGSTGVVPLGFQIDFLGGAYDSVHVNNNGNVTFDGALGTYTPFPLLSTSRVIVAPFFGDVDTRNAASGVVTYGRATFAGRPALCVNWVDVGYYAAAVDKLNSFQLLLVDRSNVAPGDFDIVFNVDRVRWETGDASGGSGGLGGASARSGYASSGFEALELEGSGVNGALLDGNGDTGLVHRSMNSTQLGRYVFRVRNGEATGAAVSGTVTDEDGDPVAGAPVDVCAVGGGCASTATGPAGGYRVEAVPDGTYTVRVGAPAGTLFNTAVSGPVSVRDDDVVVDVVLTAPTLLPLGTGLTPAREGGSVPVVFWGEPLQLRTSACAGGAATYTVTGSSGTMASGAMDEAPAGTYTATIAPLSPNHGWAEVTIRADCPAPDPDEVTTFDVYIDPSGHVVDQAGRPVAGATVTLLRSDSETGPFEVVPDGSSVMSPANRRNPMVTGGDGRFGWDTIAGYYVVRAEAAGCTHPLADDVTFVETPVLPVPPPQLDLELVLDCGEAPTAEALVASMLATVDGMRDAPPGVVRSLVAKLEAALASIGRGGRVAACGTLGSVANEVAALDGKWVDTVTAADLASAAVAARALLGCR